MVWDVPSGSFSVAVTVESDSGTMLVVAPAGVCSAEPVSSWCVSQLSWGDAGSVAGVICPWDFGVDVSVTDELLSSSVEMWAFVL